MNASGSTGEFKVPARTYLLWIAIIGLIPLLVIFRQSRTNKGRELSQAEFMELVKADRIATAVINLDPQSPRLHSVRGAFFESNSRGERIVADGAHAQVPFYSRVYLLDRDLQDLLNKPNFHATRPNTLLLNVFWSLSPILLIAGLIYFVFIRQIRNAASRQSVEPPKPHAEFAGIIHLDPGIVQRAPVFVGTEVPLQRLVDALERGESIEQFLVDNPSVKKNQVIAVIEAGKQKMLETLVH
jgi:uncharacterized protein (DUF433 family)